MLTLKLLAMTGLKAVGAKKKKAFDEYRSKKTKEAATAAMKNVVPKEIVALGSSVEKAGGDLTNIVKVVCAPRVLL